MADLTQFAVKTLEQVRTDYLSDYSNGLQRRGVVNPNTSFGTEIYARASAIAGQVAVALANIPIQADALMPDSAQGDDLVRQGNIKGLKLRPPGGSSGGITFANSGVSSSLVVDGAQLLDNQGQSYKVAVGGTYASGARIPLLAISTGSSTNLPAGSVLRWVSPPAFSASTAVVAAGGLLGGTDAETLEAYRTRLLDRIRNPPGGGNAAQVNLWAEESTTAVQKCFCYPCINGGATLQACACGAPTLTNKTRAIDPLILATVILPALEAEIVEFSDITLTTSTDVPLDVTVGLALPVSAAASGPGGGWLDGDPFPVFSSTGKANVTAVTNSTSFSVNSDLAPTPGVTRIAWLSPFDWTLYLGTVLTTSGTGPYAITIDQPFNGIAVGEFISPQAERLAIYFNQLLSAFTGLGPGELSLLPGLMPRQLRKPLITQSWPSAPTAAMLRTVEDSGTEVQDTAYLYRSATSCPLPATPSLGPNIFVPRRLAFYPL